MAEALPAAGISISECAHTTQIAVRGQSSDPAFAQAVTTALGIALPTDACTASGAPERVHMLWMGPDEWLVVGPAKTDDRIGDKLEQALNKLHCAVVDVSESRTVVQICGANARSVLDKGCSIDLHPTVFSPGRVVNTVLARSHITLHQTAIDAKSGFPSYDIYVHRSFAEYLWSWLEDASREYGLQMNP